VIQQQSGSIAGGGFVVNPAATASPKSAGQYAGDPGLKTNFGFNVKFNHGGTNLQGNVNIIDRSGGRVYQFKSNSLTSLNVLSATHATFTGKANVQDVTDPNNAISIDGNATIQMELYDNGSGSSDTIGITVLNKNGGVYFSNYWNGTQTVQQTLGGGNLQIIPAQFLAGARAVGLPAPAPLTPEALRPIVAEAEARWVSAGVSPQQLAALGNLTFRIDDLPGNDLGMESEGVVTLDRTADGYGWFVDPTPANDSEFAANAVNSPARGHVDLLSVVAHEMGHALGYFEDSDAANSVMSADLPLGVRRVPEPAAQVAGRQASSLTAADLLAVPQAGQSGGLALQPTAAAGGPAVPSGATPPRPANPPSAGAAAWTSAPLPAWNQSARPWSAEALDLVFADLDLLQEAPRKGVTGSQAV
jgi:hypothetical protein